MSEAGTVQLIEAVLGSTQVFSRAISSVVEDEVLQDSGDARLTPTQITILKLIHHTGSRTLTELAALLDVSNAAASKSVDRLVRRKLLARREAKSDRRLTELSLTPTGREILSRYSNKKKDMLARTFRHFEAEELKTAASVLDRLSAALLSGREDTCLQCYLYGETCAVRQTDPSDCRSLKRRLRSRDSVLAREARL